MTAFFIGDVALDEYYTAERWPGPADKGFVTELPSEAGGSIANAAVVHAGFGGRPEFISLLNASPLSERLIADLAAHQVATRHMLRDPAIPESRNFIFLVGGEHIVLTVEMGQQPMWLPPQTMTALRAPGYLYTTLYRVRRLHAQIDGQVLAQAELLADLRAHGRKLVFDLDVGGATDADLPYLQGAEVVIMNQTGFRNTFGQDDIRCAQAWMAQNQIRTLIRTAAAEGATAMQDGTLFTAAGYAVEVADVTGAGDTFGGTLVHGLEQGWTLQDTLAFAVAAASRSVTQHGPRSGRTTPQNVKNWIQKNQNNKG